MRGLVREALDLVGLVAGAFIAFWLAGPLGEFLIDTFGVPPELATIGGGILLFVLFAIALSAVAHYLSRMMKLPGLNIVNRVGGAVLAAGWGVVLLLVVINVARVMPLSEGWQEAFEESVVVETIAGPDAFPQQRLEEIGGDHVLNSLATIRSLFDSSRVVPEGEEVVSIPPAPEDEIRQVRDEAGEVGEMVNQHRTGLGLRALVPSQGFNEVAEARAEEMYTSGRLSRNTLPGQRVAADLTAAGLTFALSGENIALASSSRAAFDALLDSTSGLAQLSIAAYDRMGVAVVDGPTGRLLVIVFGG